MEKEELLKIVKQYIKENVIVSVEEKSIPYDSTFYYKVRLYIEDEKEPFSESEFSLPNR